MLSGEDRPTCQGYTLLPVLTKGDALLPALKICKINWGFNMDFIKLASVLDNLCRIDAVQNQEVLKHLFDALQNSQAAPCGKNLVLLDGTEATAAFLLVNWVFRETIEENLECLATISVLLKSTFGPPCGVQIKRPRINAFMQLAITQLPHLDRLFVEDPVTVILADNTCPHANGLYYTNANISDQHRDLIVLT